MLLRSSSTPLMNSGLQWHSSSSYSPESPELPISQPPNSIIFRCLSSSSFFDLRKPNKRSNENLKCCMAMAVHGRLSAITADGDEDGDEDDDAWEEKRLVTLPSSAKELSYVQEDGETLQAAAAEAVVVVGGGGGNGGGRICGGGRGSGGGDEEEEGGGSDHSGSKSGHESVDVYYQKMIEANPSNSLLLSNYARYLIEVRADYERAEEYCGRAIVANPGDGNVLSLYADLIWRSRKDANRAQSYFDRAIQATPQDCYVMASYARFLWDSEDDDDESCRG